MKITAIREMTIRLEGNVAKAVVSFADYAVSLVAVLTDVVRNGKPLVGLA